MKNDAIINKIAHVTGCSRKEVLDTLKNFGMLQSKGNPFEKAKGVVATKKS